jgi:hypothetical protein
MPIRLIHQPLTERDGLAGALILLAVDAPAILNIAQRLLFLRGSPHKRNVPGRITSMEGCDCLVFEQVILRSGSLPIVRE